MTGDPDLAEHFRRAAERFTEAADAAKVGSRRRTKFDAYATALQVAADVVEDPSGTAAITALNPKPSGSLREG